MTEELIREMVRVNEGDARRINHALKVYGIAKCIAGCEGTPERTRQIIEAAAVLHDIAIRRCEQKYGSCAGPLQEQEGPGVARPLLEKHTKDAEMVERVCWLIAHHHTLKDVRDIDHRVLIEADLIVNAEEGEFTPEAFARAYGLHIKTAAGRELAKRMLPDLLAE